MHMSDALISPAVGGTMLAVSAGLIFFSSTHLRKNFDASKIPLMGVMGAFVFAMQMINFAIPATGSSGHIGGAILLAALLGPCAAFLALTCVLAIQALFFADGGLIALGCNVFNMGFFACFIAYPLIFKPIAKDYSSSTRIAVASILSATIALQLGAFCVVLQTLLSGVTELPFKTFAFLMQPIHLAIGIVEGLLTAATISFIYKVRPQIFNVENPLKSLSMTATLASLFLATLIIGGGVSLLASSNPDGLEWAIENTTDGKELLASGEIHEASATLQEKTSLLADYSIANIESNVGTSLAGIIGSVITLFSIVLLAVILKKRKSIDA